MTPELPSWPTPLQALALVVSPKLGLRQYTRRYNQNTNFLKVIENLKTYLFKYVMAMKNSTRPCNVSNTMESIKMCEDTCHFGHVGYMASRLVSCDYHPKKKTHAQKEISNQDPIEGSFQTFRSRISNDHINMFGMFPKTPPFFSNSLERHKRPCCPIFD